MPADRPETGPRARTLAQARAVLISTAVAALPHAVRRCSQRDATRAWWRPRRHSRTHAASRTAGVASESRRCARTPSETHVPHAARRLAAVACASIYSALAPRTGHPVHANAASVPIPGALHWNARRILSTHINVSTEAWPMGIRRRSVPSAQQDTGRFLLGARIPRRTHAPARGRRVRRSARIRTRTHPGDPTCAPWAYDAGAPPSPPGRPYLEGVGPCIRACRAGQPRATGLAAHPEKASAQGAHT